MILVYIYRHLVYLKLYRALYIQTTEHSFSIGIQYLTDISIVNIPAIAKSHKGRCLDVDDVGKFVPGKGVANKIASLGGIPRAQLSEEPTTH